MDDNNKIVNQNVNPVAQASPVQPQVPVQPTAPVGSPNKETAPVGASVSEFVKPSETQPQINQELADLGVESKKDEPNIADEHKRIIDHAKQFTPVQASPSGKVSLPMSEDEVADKLKTGQDDDSGKWLSKLIQKIMKVMGL